MAPRFPDFTGAHVSYEHREYIGTILPPFDAEKRRETKNGWYLDFNIEQTGGKILPCRVFQEVYEAASKCLEAGKKVALFGYLYGEQLRVKVAREFEKPAVHKHLAFNGQTAEEARADFARRKKEMAAKGFVPVKEPHGLSWYPEPYVIKEGHVYKLKVDYVMEKLGAPYVSHKLRAEKFVELKKGSTKMAVGIQSLYLKLLDELVGEAQAADASEF